MDLRRLDGGQSPACCSCRDPEYEATRFSSVEAIDTGLKVERSFLDAVLMTTEGAVALERISFGRRHGGLLGDAPRVD